MAQFLLVHGAWHGAWCWDELVAILERRGHDALAIDLPGGGLDQTPLSEVTLAACAQRIVEALERFDGKVWLVGHSLGGASISAAAEAAPEKLAGLIYVTALAPRNGLSAHEASDYNAGSILAELVVMHAEDNSASIPETALRDAFYHLCSDAQVATAKAKLRPRQAIEPSVTPLTLTAGRYGAAPRYYVECLQDRAITIETQRNMIAAAGMNGVATLDADHSPFFSCPEALADAMIGFTKAP